ncbi:MAG: hypothetical protein M5U28_32330 [Sandaracinaceae bacterium]|nr:hypothetical protein [Sandaracinaceae bacterium]
MLALSIAGCGGATGSVATLPAAEPDDGCGPSATRLGAECWSAAGTRWSVVADGPSGEYTFELELLAAGRARATDDRSASPGSDEWFQDGRLLRVFLADRFVEYRASIENGTVLVGEATNVRGQRWSWSATRLFGESVCQEGEARVGEACFTVAGTRWQLGEGAPIELLAGGALARGGQDAAEGDRWEQRGEAVHFSLGGRRYEGRLEGDRELRGTVDGASFTATRLESIPPLARR